MDKNTMTGLVLMGLLLIGFSWWSQPSAEEQAKKMQQDSIAAVTQHKAELAKQQAHAKEIADLKAKQKADTTALFHAALEGQAQEVVLKNEHLELSVNTKGGTVSKAIIKNFKDREDNPDVVLFDDKVQKLNFIMSTKEANIATQDLYFSPSAQTDSTLTLTADAGQGKSLVIQYRLGADYLLHMSMKVNGMNGLFAPNTKFMNVDWTDKCRQQEKGFTFENRYATLTYHKVKGGTKKLSEASEEIDKKIDDKIDWVAFKNQFFSAVMIAKHDFSEEALMTSVPQEKGSGYLKAYQAKMQTFFDPTGQKASEFEFYFGPNDFRLLNRIEKESSFNKDLELQRLVYLGWPLFRIINRWFTIYVFDWLSKWFPMGVVLILITLLLKLITFPMVKKSYMSSAKMRVLKPKLEAATAQYNKPEDQMQKQQAMMAEYSKYGVSPLSGCLPMLIQMPIWIAMFNFVPNAIQLRGESFLWINDLSTYDPIIQWNKNIWLIGDHLSLTCILFCIANVLYSWMTMRQQRDQMVGQQAEQMKMMQWMMYLMPVMFFFMFNDYSAGLNFYYFVSLFFSAAIMWTLRKTTNDAKLLQILEARYEENKANPKKLSGLAARLQAMQEQQQEMQRKREELERKKRKL
ncbi:membrane protein insertase YidC [Hoylesella timonensis]|uniref:membrane protein insertase YidC n=1 Tax=Hoylesella timonensis TaxID=386414 RepID=UPI002889B22C|nr:membrane protein insertase YidC [Hoylesella timonensis]